MSGWNATVPIRLDEPWSEFTVNVYSDPPIGAFLEAKAAAAEAMAQADEANLRRAVASAAALVASHDITDREGQPLVLELGALTPSLLSALLDAVLRGTRGAADPPLATGKSSGGSPRASGSRTTSRRSSSRKSSASRTGT